MYTKTYTKEYTKMTPKHKAKTASPQLINNEGYMTRIWSSISHVASSDPKCFHYTLTCLIDDSRAWVAFLQYTLRLQLEFSIWFHLQYKTVNQMINILNILLKQWYMENIIEFHFRRQCKSIGYMPNPLNDTEGSTKPWCHLGTRSNPQGALLWFDVLVHLFPNVELLEQHVSICITLLPILCCH